MSSYTQTKGDILAFYKTLRATVAHFGISVVACVWFVCEKMSSLLSVCKLLFNKKEAEEDDDEEVAVTLSLPLSASPPDRPVAVDRYLAI